MFFILNYPCSFTVYYYLFGVSWRQIWRENTLGYLSLEITCSEKRAVLRECTSRNASYELWGMDNVQGQISEHIFRPNRWYFVYYPLNIFRNTRGFENWCIAEHFYSRWSLQFIRLTCLERWHIYLPRTVSPLQSRFLFRRIFDHETRKNSA